MLRNAPLKTSGLQGAFDTVDAIGLGSFITAPGQRAAGVTDLCAASGRSFMGSMR